jgi:hypothetical protein
VVSDIAIRVGMVLVIMVSFMGHIVIMKGAFPLGDFSPQHEMHLEVPQGFEDSCQSEWSFC